MLLPNRAKLYTAVFCGCVVMGLIFTAVSKELEIRSKDLVISNLGQDLIESQAQTQNCIEKNRADSLSQINRFDYTQLQRDIRIKNETNYTVDTNTVFDDFVFFMPRAED